MKRGRGPHAPDASTTADKKRAAADCAGTPPRRLLGVSGGHLEHHHVGSNEKLVDASPAIPRDERVASRRRKRGALRSQPGRHSTGKTHLREEPGERVPQARPPAHGPHAVRHSVKKSRSPGPAPSSKANDQGRSPPHLPSPGRPPSPLASPSVEDGKPLGRGAAPKEQQLPVRVAAGDHYLLRSGDEDLACGTVSPRPTLRDSWRRNAAAGKLHPRGAAHDPEGRAPFSLRDAKNQGTVAAVQLLGAQYKEGCHHAPAKRPAGRQPPPQYRAAAGEARPQLPGARRPHGSVQPGAGGGSAPPGHGFLDLPPLVSDDWAATLVDPPQPTNVHSVLPRRAHARLPQTDAERAAPLQVVKVATMDFDRVCTLLAPAKLERMNHIWELLRKCPRQFDSLDADGPQNARLPEPDIAALYKARILEPCTAPAHTFGSAFTVVEEKKGTLRRRFILWPKQVNQWLEDQGYASAVDLNTQPWNLALDECGGVTDLTTSFFQVPVPLDIRPLFCLRGADGQAYQLTVLPMGLSVSPEVMQLITAALAGHPQYAATPASGVNVNVWIDNIQLTGCRKAVETALERTKRLAEKFNVSLNLDETCVSCAYTFAGVAFDHSARTVRLGEKTHRKLQADSVENLTVEQLERLMGRLWFAARVLRIPVHRYWWFLKATRRLFSQWSRGIITGAAPATLRASAQQAVARVAHFGGAERAEAHSPPPLHAGHIRPVHRCYPYGLGRCVY